MSVGGFHGLRRLGDGLVGLPVARRVVLAAGERRAAAVRQYEVPHLPDDRRRVVRLLHGTTRKRLVTTVPMTDGHAVFRRAECLTTRSCIPLDYSTTAQPYGESVHSRYTLGQSNSVLACAIKLMLHSTSNHHERHAVRSSHMYITQLTTCIVNFPRKSRR